MKPKLQMLLLSAGIVIPAICAIANIWLLVLSGIAVIISIPVMFNINKNIKNEHY